MGKEALEPVLWLWTTATPGSWSNAQQLGGVSCDLQRGKPRHSSKEVAALEEWKQDWHPSFDAENLVLTSTVENLLY